MTCHYNFRGFVRMIRVFYKKYYLVSHIAPKTIYIYKVLTLIAIVLLFFTYILLLHWANFLLTFRFKLVLSKHNTHRLFFIPHVQEVLTHFMIKYFLDIQYYKLLTFLQGWGSGFGQKTGSGALYLKLREIFKSR